MAYKYGEKLVRGTLRNGTEGLMDPLDMLPPDFQPFGKFVMESLELLGLKYGTRSDREGSDVIRYRQFGARPPEHERVDTGLGSAAKPNLKKVEDVLLAPDTETESRNIGIVEGTGPGATTKNGSMPPPANTEKPGNDNTRPTTPNTQPPVNTITPPKAQAGGKQTITR